METVVAEMRYDGDGRQGKRVEMVAEHCSGGYVGQQVHQQLRYVKSEIGVRDRGRRWMRL